MRNRKHLHIKNKCPKVAGESVISRAYFTMTNNYINERIKNPRYAIMLNGIIVKKIPFYNQATKYANRHKNRVLFKADVIEVVDLMTGEIFS